MVRDTDVQEFIDLVAPIRNKELGGCLVMCYAFYRWLEHKGLDQDTFYIVQYDSMYDGDNIEHNLAWIEGKNDEPTSANHFTRLYHDKEYHSTGHYRNSYGRTVLTGLTEKDIIEEFCIDALNYAPWNGDFDRPTEIPRLELILGIDLSEIETFSW